MKNKIGVDECVKYVESLGYALTYRRNKVYCFKDVTGKRPPHNSHMMWTLAEMRHAVKFGC